jgi:hypothetical protein
VSVLARSVEKTLLVGGAGEEDRDGAVHADTVGGRTGFDCGAVAGTVEGAGAGLGTAGGFDPPMFRVMVGAGGGASVGRGRSRGGLEGGV